MFVPRVLEARAFAPGHVTGVFRPDASQRDPRARGSVGAGLVLELGVWGKARFSPGARSRVRVVADCRTPLPISEEVARRLAPEASGTLTVRLTHELPIGQGFGMSAAGALATALAVGSLSGRPRSKAIDVAHLADLFGGGGLGGVAAILGGGLEVRTRPGGLPPFGHVTHRSFPPALLVGVIGRPISSPSGPEGRQRPPQDRRGVPRLAATRTRSLDPAILPNERTVHRPGRPRFRGRESNGGRAATSGRLRLPGDVRSELLCLPAEPKGSNRLPRLAPKGRNPHARAPRLRDGARVARTLPV